MSKAWREFDQLKSLYVMSKCTMFLFLFFSSRPPHRSSENGMSSREYITNLTFSSNPHAEYMLIGAGKFSGMLRPYENLKVLGHWKHGTKQGIFPSSAMLWPNAGRHCCSVFCSPWWPIAKIQASGFALIHSLFRVSVLVYIILGNLVAAIRPGNIFRVDVVFV